MANLTQMNRQVTTSGTRSYGGRKWLNVIAVHFKQMSLPESNKAKAKLRLLKCTDLYSVGDYLLRWDRLSALLSEVRNDQMLELLMGIFGGVPEVYTM